MQMARAVQNHVTLKAPPHPAIKGRGALSNESGRYEAEQRVAVDDGWHRDDTPLRTEIFMETARRIITTNKSPDLPFDRSINPYRGCEHGCVYCYARPTHTYMGLSAGLDFETKLFAKPGAAKLLTKELADPKYRPKAIALGTNTDPYQPIEKRLKITRSVLEVLAAHDHPCTIVTKSHLVTRDMDIIAAMAAKGLVKVFLSITTLNKQLARAMEPRAATPGLRLDTLKQLSGAGIPTGVMVAPIIPALTDGELESILEQAAQAGVKQAGYIMLRLPLEVKYLFKDWLEQIAPYRADHVMRLVHDIRNGRDNDPRWGKRMRGTGPYAKMIAQRFNKAVARLGLNREELLLDTTLFRTAQRKGQQLALF